MGFLKKYYKRIEQGRPTIEWDAIELADEEIEELWKAINHLRKRAEYDEADEAKLEERVDNLAKELKEFREEIEVLKERIKKLEERIEELESKCEEEVYI